MSEYCLPEKGKAALVTISAQKDFTDQNSPVRACGHGRAVPVMRRVTEMFRAAGQPIFHSVRLYRPDGSNVEACRRPWLDEGVRIFMPGSFGSELLDELKPDPSIRLEPQLLLSGKFQKIAPSEFLFYRPRWGAFHKTALEDHLADRGVTTLVLCGFSFSTGIRASIYEASARDLKIVLVPDATCNATEEGLHEIARLGVYQMDSRSLGDWLCSKSKTRTSAAA